MQHERGYFLDSLSSAVCWLTVCMFIGYLSAQILLWHRTVEKSAHLTNGPEPIYCSAGEESGSGNFAEFSAREGGLFDHFQWELVKT